MTPVPARRAPAPERPEGDPWKETGLAEGSKNTSPGNTQDGQRRSSRTWLTKSDPAAPPERAVALEYDMETDGAPRVVAKGHGPVAERIVEVALKNGVMIRRDADLVAILDALDIDAQIPLEAFTAVAEILSYVYQANGRMSTRAGRKENASEQ